MSIDTPAVHLPDLELARPAHDRWSELNGRFLDHAEAHPHLLERETFASIYQARWLRKLDLNPWPLFMDAARRAEAERITLGIDALVKGVTARFLRNDPATILEFFGAGQGEGGGPLSRMGEKMLSVVLMEPDGISTAPSRTDFVEDADGLKCLEYNAGSSLGGLQTGDIGEQYLACPAIAGFLDEQGRRARAPDTVGALLRHFVDETERMGVWRGGDFNVAVITRPHNPEQIELHAGEMYERALRRVLRERGISGGRAFACGAEDLREEGGAPFIGEHRIHVVMDQHDGSRFPRDQFRQFKQGRVNFVSGPIGSILSDKRFLALLSENAASDDFTAAERALVEAHLPWTRRVLPGVRTTFRGRGFRLPDDIADYREELVLKKATSMAGLHVRVGRFRTDAEWRADVAQAAREGDWIVQQYVQPIPYLFQTGEQGAVLHDLVWGLFAFGAHYGGAFLRMQPRGSGGVVNTHRGAEVGVFLELED